MASRRTVEETSTTTRAGVIGSVAGVFRVRLDDLANEPVTNNVRIVQVVEPDPVNPREYALDLYQARLFTPRKIDLGFVAGDDRLRVDAKSREKHFHLRVRRILRFIQNHERVGKRPPPHVRERGDLDGPRLKRLLHALGRHHVFECVIKRAKIWIDLRLKIPRKKAKTFSSFDCGPREDDPPNTLLRERIDRSGDSEICLPRSCRPDSDDDVVLGDDLEILALAARLRLNDLADSGKDDALKVIDAVAFARRIDAHPQHVVRRQLHLLLRG